MTEIWKDIPNYIGQYQVSNLGNIRSIDKIIPHWRGGNRLIKGTTLNRVFRKGYAYVNLSHLGDIKIKSVARLVALAFVPNPENKPQVNHMDGDKWNDNYTNLEWVTCRENQLHACRTGLKKPRYGDDMHTTKVKYKDVIRIRKMYQTKIYTQSQLAERFNCSSALVNMIINNRTRVNA